MEFPFRKVPKYLPENPCCKDMKRHLTLNAECEQHGYNCPDRVIGYSGPKSFPSELFYLRGINGNYRIYHCPWCGEKLPNDHHHKDSEDE